MGTPPLRLFVTGGLAVCAAALIVACGSSPVAPPPPPPPPPVNNLPVIDSITVQGTRPKEPASFADVGEAVPVSARVRDDETAVDQLVYAWTATTGTFSGTGASVIWRAPETVAAPTVVTITLTVTENYGSPGGPLSFKQSVTATADLSLHDSMQEVGSMSRQFLLDFSDSTIRDVPYIMRNFSKLRCPQPSEVDSETGDVTNNRLTLRIVDSRVGNPLTSLGFGGTCPFRGKRGDSCAVVPVFWDSIELATNKRGTTSGNDIVAAVYAPADSRWWLCASDYQGTGSFASRFAGLSATR